MARSHTALRAKPSHLVRGHRLAVSSSPSPRPSPIGYVFTVAQIFNLPYRRFVIGRTPIIPTTLNVAATPQVTNLRYSRLQVCATGVGSTVKSLNGFSD